MWPLPSGKQPAISNFRDKLRKHIPLGVRVMGNSGYGAEEHSDIMSTLNDLNPKEKAYFKNVSWLSMRLSTVILNR
eukprot:9440483-Ditylum_brightwellii.AAC.1